MSLPFPVGLIDEQILNIAAQNVERIELVEPEVILTKGTVKIYLLFFKARGHLYEETLQRAPQQKHRAPLQFLLVLWVNLRPEYLNTETKRITFESS